ncbi:MAG: hypothetical protein ACYC66_16930, partial [Chloroflexota bacterium]
WRRAAIALAIGAVLIGALSFVLSVALQWGKDPISESLREAAIEDGWILLSAFRLRVGVALFCLVAGPVLLAACVRHWISHRTLEWLAVGLTATTLFLLGWIQNPWLPPSALYDPPALTKVLKQETDLFRVFSWAPRFSTYNVGVFYRGIVGRSPSVEFEEHYLRQFIPPNLGMLFGVSTAEWYDALQTRRQALIANYMGSERAEPVRYSDGDFVDWKTRTMSLHDRLNLLAALNVKYLTHAFEIEDPRLEKVETLEVQIYPELPAVARVHLYRLNTAMPRAFVVPRSTAIQGEKQVLEALLAGTPDLRQEVILEEEVSPPQPPVLTPSGSEVEILDYRGEQVRLRARTDGSGFLVLTDFLLPGWSVRVDGRPEAILAANFAGRAVVLEGAGEHLVEFSYQPPLLKEGLLVSLASLAVLAAVLVSWRFRERRSLSPPLAS